MSQSKGGHLAPADVEVGLVRQGVEVEGAQDDARRQLLGRREQRNQERRLQELLVHCGGCRQEALGVDKRFSMV